MPEVQISTVTPFNDSSVEAAANNDFDINAEISGTSVYRQKVLVLNFDPVIEKAGGKKQHELMTTWGSPKDMAQQYIDDMAEASYGNALYSISQWVDINELPQAENGQSYSTDEYYDTLMTAQTQSNYWDYSGWKKFGRFNYDYYLTKYNVYSRVESGEIDEVWVFTGPCTGTEGYETLMIGRDAYFCNSEPMIRDDCRAFVCYVFNYEREVGCMLEDAGHRFESILIHIFGLDTNKPIDQMNDWEKFSLYDKIAPGEAGCGVMHFAPNSQSDYDWGNTTMVASTCNDWADYPNLTGAKTQVNCADWGSGDMREHHMWWFSLIPHVSGKNQNTGKLNNWWVYFKYPTAKTDETTQSAAATAMTQSEEPSDDSGEYFINLDPDTANIENSYGSITENPGTYILTKTDGGYMLTCHTLDCVYISYDEYSVLASGGTIDTVIGTLKLDEEWPGEGVIVRSQDNMKEYIITTMTGPDDQEILRNPYVEGSDQNGDSNYYPELITTGEKQYYIPNSATVYLFNANSYGSYIATDFSDYLNNGNTTWGYPLWCYSFNATVIDNEIVELTELPGFSEEEEGDEEE